MLLFDAKLSAINPTLLLLLLASFLSNSRHMASHIILRLPSKTSPKHRPQVQLPRLCRPQVFTALLKSTISQLPKTTVTSEKMTIFFSPLLVSVFSESTGWEKHQSHTLFLTVSQDGEKLQKLSGNYIYIHLYVCLHTVYLWGERLRVLLQETVRMCECARVSVCSQRAGCIIIHAVV